MPRWLKRIILLLAAILLPAAVIIAWLGSAALVTTERRSLQDYHQRILADPAGYGLKVRILDTGTPAQLYLPAATPGAARKSRALRAELAARGIPVPAWDRPVGTLVLLHGRNGRKEDHLPIAERFCAAGFACLVCDLPGAGEHASPHSTFGAKETGEIAALLAAARQAEPLPAPAGLFGISQGGAIALQTAQQFPDDFYAVATIASFARLDAMIEQGAHRLHPTVQPIAVPATALVRIGTVVRAGFDPGRIRPAHSASSLEIPVFVGHGSLDQFIPPSHAELIYDAVPHDRKVLRMVPDGTHNDVLAKGGNDLYADIAAFFLTYLPTP